MQKSIRNILQEYVAGLFNLAGNRIKQVILYGSYARGEQNANGEISDIDIMILVDLPDSEIKQLELKILDYSYELDLKYNILISPMIENINQYNKRTQYMVFYKNIKNEGVLLNE